jgi:hypothetical protein
MIIDYDEAKIRYSFASVTSLWYVIYRTVGISMLA